MGGSATFTVTMNEVSGVDTAITFSYGGTATLGTDFSVAGNNYNPGTKTLVIPAGMTFGQITLFGLNNQTFGPDLTAAVTMQSAVNAAISAIPTSIATITEGNPGPAVSLALTGSPMPEVGGQALVTASIPKAYPSDVLINLMFTGSAVLGVNYTASGTYFNPATNTLRIPAGATSSTLVLQSVDDGLYGPNLSAVVAIQSLAPGIAPGGPVTATIIEGDAPSHGQAEREYELHLREWRSGHHHRDPLGTLRVCHDRPADLRGHGRLRHELHRGEPGV